jgi:hypothetical protein
MFVFLGNIRHPDTQSQGFKIFGEPECLAQYSATAQKTAIFRYILQSVSYYKTANWGLAEIGDKGAVPNSSLTPYNL